MRKILWLIIFFSMYVWLVTSGKDQLVLEKGKEVYEFVVRWLDDADLDFQWNSQKEKKESKEKKSRRRWD